jgi:signal transduction histidine kinase
VTAADERTVPAGLLRRLVDAAEADRAAIANELHDDAVQALAASVMHLGLLERRLPQVVAEPSWERARDNLEHGLRAARALLVDLRPPILARQGLVVALRQQLERVARQAGCATHLDWHGPDRLAPLVQAVAFRAAQEAMINAAKHGRPRNITVTGAMRDGGLAITITDDGVGIGAGTVPRQPSAWVHAELAGGSITIRAAAGGGTDVTVWLPAG